MSRLLDAAYIFFLLAVSPWLVYRRYRQRKPIAGLRVKLTGNLQRRQPEKPCLWFHAVSVGEVLQLRNLISRVQKRYPHYECVVTTTTGTGYDLAKEKFPDCTVQYFPLDFSWSVRRALKSLRPRLIVLVELELWPNFLQIAAEREIPVAIINGRISDGSYKIYRRATWLTRPLLESCSLVTAQNAAYAERFLDLGAAPSRLFQTGNIKFDGIETNRHNAQTEELRRGFDLSPHELLFLAGSTQAPEEEHALAAYEKLRAEFPQLRLLLVPRHKERFEEVAALIESRGHGLLRRSEIRESANFPSQISLPNPQPSTLNSQPILLLDTLGELSKAWGLADIAFVGGSLTNRGGQNMIEPAGFGAAVLFGPNTWNFRDITEALLAGDAARVVTDGDRLATVVRELILDAASRQRLGDAARKFVLSQQGATERTLDLLGCLLSNEPAPASKPVTSGRAA